MKKTESDLLVWHVCRISFMARTSNFISPSFHFAANAIKVQTKNNQISIILQCSVQQLLFHQRSWEILVLIFRLFGELASHLITRICWSSCGGTKKQSLAQASCVSVQPCMCCQKLELISRLLMWHTPHNIRHSIQQTPKIIPFSDLCIQEIP